MDVSEPLDAYSAIVAGVAESLTPKVASVRVPKRSGESLGSAVVFTADGFLLTNAHVVGHSTGGKAAFSDGTTTPFQVVGADPLSDLAVLRAAGDVPDPAELGEADDLVVGQLGGAVGNPLGLAGAGGGIGDGGRGERPGPVAPRGRPGDRGRDPDGRRPEPGQLRWRAGRLPGP